MKRKAPFYDWNEESGIATCILYDGDNVFLGMAQCHPDDRDMANEKTGLEIAEMRAEIKYLTHLRDNVFKPQLAALTRFQKDIEQSKLYNPDSYENSMLRRRIQTTKFDLDAVKDELSMAKENLIRYLARKEEFYNHIRSNRKKAENNQEETNIS